MAKRPSMDRNGTSVGDRWVLPNRQFLLVHPTNPDRILRAATYGDGVRADTCDAGDGVPEEVEVTEGVANSIRLN